MPSRAWLHSLNAICLTLCAYCQCYLEDVEATCAVCWITSDGITVARACPDGIAVEWETSLPQEMYDNKKYQATYNLKIDRSLFDLELELEEEKEKLYEVPHSNIHSCVKSRGVCSPFVADSPGLSTHTANTPANFSVEGTMYFQKFDTQVQLPPDEYTIIAHSRIYVKPQVQQSGASCFPSCKDKYDIVVGIGRSVVREPKSASTDAYVTAGVAGFVIILSLGSIVWASRSGKLDIEAVVMALTREEVALISDIIIQTGDMVAFTMCVKQDVMEDDDMADTVPTCIVFLVVGWLSAMVCVWKASSNLYSLWESHYRSQRYWDKQIVQASMRELVFPEEDIERASHQFEVLLSDEDDSANGKRLKRSDTFGARLAKSLIAMAAFRQYDKARRQMRGQYVSILTMLLADLPMVVVSIYILYKVDSSEFAVILSLVFSVMLLTKKASHLGRFTINVKELENAKQVVRDVATEFSLKKAAGVEKNEQAPIPCDSINQVQTSSIATGPSAGEVSQEPFKPPELPYESDGMEIPSSNVFVNPLRRL